MNKNETSFSQFAAIGGHDYEGEAFKSLRIFADYESACDYARDLLEQGYDYAFVTGVRPDGTLDCSNVTRVADDEPSVVSF